MPCVASRHTHGCVCRRPWGPVPSPERCRTPRWRPVGRRRPARGIAVPLALILMTPQLQEGGRETGARRAPAKLGLGPPRRSRPPGAHEADCPLLPGVPHCHLLTTATPATPVSPRAPGCPCPLPSHSLRPLTARGCPRGSVRAASPAAASCVARAGVFSCSVHQRVPMPQEGDWRSRDTPHVFTDGTNSYSEQSRTRE